MNNTIMNKFELTGIFPKGVVLSKELYKFSKEELDFFNQHKNKSHKNSGNTSSDECYILNDPLMQNLNNFIISGMKFYIDNIITPLEPLEFYVTQSWLNWTKPGEAHHSHEHRNSIFSGVVYINADPKSDRIDFYESGYDRLHIEPSEYHLYNSKSWWFPAETGKLILFDSSITHNVKTTTSKKDRISLAFNTYVRGHLGVENRKTGLFLK